MARKAPEATIDALALAVARGQSIAAAARALGVVDRTARRWAAEPSFKQAVDTIRASVISQSVGALGKTAVKAIRVLGKLLESKEEDIRLRSAKEVLSNMLAVREHATLSAEVAELRAQIERLASRS